MKQVLHIFKKDVRHYWIEIVVSLALIVAYGHYEVRGWGVPDVATYGTGFFGSSFWSGLVMFLTPVSWCFLLVRVVQEESLVGDRQFWVTRPYEWPRLLASKTVFVLVVVCVPLLVLQIVLLASAGFHPTSYIAGLLFMQVMLLFSVLLPIGALATATATIAQLLLALLIVVLYAVGTSWLSDQFHNSFSFRDVTDQLPGELLVATCVVVVLLQYARRATAKSRVLIAMLGLAVPLLMVASPYEFFLSRTFPILQVGQPAPFRVGLLPPPKANTTPLSAEEKEVQITVPFSTAAVQSDAIVNLAGFKVSIDTLDGMHWNSGWKSLSYYAFPQEGTAYVRLAMKREDFQRLQSVPVDLRLAVAYDLYRDREQREFVIPAGHFELPGLGMCSAELDAMRKMHCLTPLRRPQFLLVTAEMVRGTCPLWEQQSPPEPRQIARAMVQGSAYQPAEFGISPVKIVDFYLAASGNAMKWAAMGLCPGTPVTLSNPQFVESNRTEIQLQGVRLAQYREAPVAPGAVSFGAYSHQ